jgi:hypothetical protein
MNWIDRFPKKQIQDTVPIRQKITLLSETEKLNIYVRKKEINWVPAVLWGRNPCTVREENTNP